jgi:hypothetical protein
MMLYFQSVKLFFANNQIFLQPIKQQEEPSPLIFPTALAAEKRDYEYFQSIGQVLFLRFTGFFAKG